MILRIEASALRSKKMISDQRIGLIYYILVKFKGKVSRQ